MKKVCNGCGEERDAEKDFYWRHQERGIRQAHCRFCVLRKSKKHYENNKQSYLDRNRAHNPLVRQENRAKLDTYLACHPCVDCGQSDIRALEFDHVRGEKSTEVAKMANTGYSWSTIEAEIAKCEVRCANCHRIVTYERGGFWRDSLSLLSEDPVLDHTLSPPKVSRKTRILKNKRLLHDYLSEHFCVDCGCKDVRILEFDHVRGDKCDNISELISIALWSRIKAEIAKCEVRCANCHRIKTMERGNWWRSIYDQGDSEVK